MFFMCKIENFVIALNIDKLEITELSTLYLVPIFPMSVCEKAPIARWKLIEATSLGFYMRRQA